MVDLKVIEKEVKNMKGVKYLSITLEDEIGYIMLYGYTHNDIWFSITVSNNFNSCDIIIDSLWQETNDRKEYTLHNPKTASQIIKTFKMVLGDYLLNL